MMSNRREFNIPKIEPVKFVEKGNGIIKGYAVNTFHGMVKDYNEDRVSIIMNITKPNYKGRWPKCSYFGVFDGHGGDACSNFLKDNMHKYVIANLLRSPRTSTSLQSPSKHSKSDLKKPSSSFWDLPKLKIHLNDLEVVLWLFLWLIKSATLPMWEIAEQYWAQKGAPKFTHFLMIISLTRRWKNLGLRKPMAKSISRLSKQRMVSLFQGHLELILESFQSLDHLVISKQNFRSMEEIPKF